jgi:hypothetical protein
MVRKDSIAVTNIREKLQMDIRGGLATGVRMMSITQRNTSITDPIDTLRTITITDPIDTLRTITDPMLIQFMKHRKNIQQKNKSGVMRKAGMAAKEKRRMPHTALIVPAAILTRRSSALLVVPTWAIATASSGCLGKIKTN